MANRLSPSAQRATIVIIAIILRAIVGLSGYSGAGTPPKFGDYEAQRHWMELTINLPPTEWYVESAVNNASYWPLDYPPLSGYQSWLHGQLLRRFEPEAVELIKSHGYETPSSKLLMRLTVILSDILVYFPAAWACSSIFTKGSSAFHQTFTLAVLLLQPALVIVDHGHFQYNCIGLGLAAAAAAALGAGRQLLGSFLFCLSLNHKQMGLYFAPAFFAHLLGWSLHQRTMGGKVLALAKLGVTVIATFAVCWAPVMRSPSDVLVLLQRIFPIKRGLFEDYVANFWCASSVAIKWRDLLPQPLLLRLCAGITIAVAAPAMVQQVLRPSPRGLLLCMANSAMAFFMFSFQVHEKSILLPLLPITILSASEPALALWTPLVACFSMYPLLYRDGVIIAYCTITLLYLAVMWSPAQQLFVAQSKHTGKKAASAHDDVSTAGNKGSGQARRLGFGRLGQTQGLLASPGKLHATLAAMLVCLLLVMHAARLLIAPPEHLPWLHDRAFITLGFGFFAVVALYLQVRQWQCPASPSMVGKSRETKKAQ